MKAAELKAGDFITVDFGAMHPTGLVIIHGAESHQEVRTSSGAVVSEARVEIVGTRLDSDTPYHFTLPADSESHEKGIGGWQPISAASATLWLNA